MKRRMIWILLAGILVGITLSGLYKHFVTDRIMDGGNGMENPDAAFLLDGVTGSQLDGAHMLAGQVLASAAGIGAKQKLITPFSLDINGKAVTLESIEEFGRRVLEDIHPRDSWRASKAFRSHIAVESAKRCLIESVKLAGGVL